MEPGHIAGTIMLGLLLGAAWSMGAPVPMLASIAALVAVIAATMLLPGVGARAFRALATKAYDRAAWEERWANEPHGGPERGRGRRVAREDLPPELLPPDLRGSKAWLRTLADIRGLPEHDARAKRGRRRRGSRHG